jgi:hypothetical protein
MDAPEFRNCFGPAGGWAITCVFRKRAIHLSHPIERFIIDPERIIVTEMTLFAFADRHNVTMTEKALQI